MGDPRHWHPGRLPECLPAYIGSLLIWEPLEFWNSHYSGTTTLWCKRQHYCFMKKKWACTEGSIHIWWRAPSLFCGQCTHIGGVLVRGHSGGIFRVSEVCGMVCNMKTVVFESQSMGVIKHLCIQVDVNFIVTGRMVSGSSVWVQTWNRYLLNAILFCFFWQIKLKYAF